MKTPEGLTSGTHEVVPANKSYVLTWVPTAAPPRVALKGCNYATFPNEGFLEDLTLAPQVPK